MTEPSPSPIPTMPSSQSWLDWISPLDNLWKDHPFVAFIAGLLMTAAVIPLTIWLGKRAWTTWKRKRHSQRVAARRQQLPSVRLPFTIEPGHQRLTLAPAQPQREDTTECMSIVRLLSAKSTPVPFLDRAKALTRLEMWARSEERFAIYVLGGDGGSGKTRLGVELCRRLTTPNTHRRGAEVWQAGFLQNIEHSDSTSSSDDASSLLLVVDYAEARPEVATEVINIALRAAEDPERRRVRIIFLVRRPSPLAITRRSSNEWIDVLRPQDSFSKEEHKDGNDAINSLLDNTSTIVLNDKELSEEERKDLFKSAYSSFTEPPGSLPPPHLLEQLCNPTYSQPLLVTVDAFLNARPLPHTQHGCSPDELFEEILCHEEHYWAEHWTSSSSINTDRDQQRRTAAAPAAAQDEKRKSLNRELARQAVAAATLTDIQDEEDAINLLNLLPANHPGKNTRDLAKWLRECYPPHMNGNGHSALWCEHLEPDRIGEHLIVSETNHLIPLLQELLSPRRVGTSSLRTWTVLERTSTDPHLNEHVGRILNDMLVEVTQTVHAQTVNSQSPDLAAAFTKLFSAVRSHIEPDEAHEAEQSLSNAGYLTIFLECELAQRAADITPPTDESPEIDRATYASRILSLSRCLAASGRRDEALKTAQEATNLYRTLAEHNPAAYNPDLAMSLNNLAIDMESNGQQREALQTAQEAVTIRRKLAEHNPAAYTPDLAMSLNTLASYLDRSGQQREALQTAQEATNLYRTLAEHNPAAHTPNLATSLNNLANHLDRSGQQREALQTAQEAVTIRRKLAEHNPAAHTPNLTRSLNTYADILERSGNTKEAARIRQERDEVLKRMKEMEEGEA